jgi:peptide/nickel transport system substrate-binding protein
MFAGNTMLLPKSSTANPEVFNKSQLNGPGPSAGPFMISDIDRGAQRITLTRNPKWWGDTPVLDSITYSVLDDAARIPALQNNALDATGVASLDELTIARNTPGISIRRAPSPSWYHFTFNGAPGSILADKALRLAIAKGIDRNIITTVTQRGLADNPTPLNNHIFVAGQEGYQDNSEVVAFDPEKAKAELDALGWKLPSGGQFREKDGKRLTIRDVLYDSQSTKQIAQIAQNSLAQIGVELRIEAKPGTGFFTDWIIPGNFDIAQFAWVGDAFSLCCLNQIYTTGAESNFGKISSPEIDAKVEETFNELDPGKARTLANELDKLIWAEGFSLPLFQTPGNVAVRSNLANYGPAGIGDLDVTKIGFMK